ncbi:amidohydrolase [Microbacterium sp. NPDC057650]|uniref:amidohydrolase n=1 Tax=unclassified Microbacterium TaxID=2609290 RepID=UPI00366BB366
MENTDPQTVNTPAEMKASRRQLLQGGAAIAVATAGAGLLGAAPAAASGHGSDTKGPKDAEAVVLRNVRPFGGAARDLICHDGVLVDRVPRGTRVFEINGRGRLALPTLIDAHIHPAKTGWGEKWQSRKPASGTKEVAAGDIEFAKGLTKPTAERALGLLRHAVATGTRGVRAHGDVAPAYGLSEVEGMRAAQEKLRGILDMQIVGFPQQGVMVAPGTIDLLDKAARDGVIDFVGGIDPTAFDGAEFATQQLDAVFGIATRHGVGIDIHLHESGEMGLHSLRDILARTRAAGLTDGQVNISHAFAIPSQTPAVQDELAAEIAALNVTLTTVAPRSGLLPFKKLRERGIPVGLGSDGIRDNWSPYGNADMLHRTWILGFVSGARVDEDLERGFDLAATGGADVMGLAHATLEVGSPADMMIIDGENIPQVVIDQPRRDYILRGGRVVAKNGEMVV